MPRALCRVCYRRWNLKEGKLPEHCAHGPLRADLPSSEQKICRGSYLPPTTFTKKRKKP